MKKQRFTCIRPGLHISRDRIYTLEKIEDPAIGLRGEWTIFDTQTIWDGSYGTLRLAKQAVWAVEEDENKYFNGP